MSARASQGAIRRYVSRSACAQPEGAPPGAQPVLLSPSSPSLPSTSPREPPPHPSPLLAAAFYSRPAPSLAAGRRSRRSSLRAALPLDLGRFSGRLSILLPRRSWANSSSTRTGFTTIPIQLGQPRPSMTANSPVLSSGPSSSRRADRHRRPRPRRALGRTRPPAAHAVRSARPLRFCATRPQAEVWYSQ